MTDTKKPDGSDSLHDMVGRDSPLFDETVERRFKELQKRHPMQALDLGGHFQLVAAAKRLAEKDLTPNVELSCRKPKIGEKL